MPKNGFAPIVGIILVSLVLIAGVLFLNAPKSSRQQTDDRGGGEKGLYGRCEGSGTTKLETFPVNPQDIELITPMGRVQDSHVTPTDHQYVIPKGTTGGGLITDNPGKYQIKAPFDGYITNVELFKEPVESAYRKDPYRNNYLVVFEYSCDFYVRLIHIDTLAENIDSQVEFRDSSSQHPTAHPRIKVKEGDVIGTVGPHSFDFQIMDTTNPDENIISPQNIDPWTSVTVDSFDYVSDSLRAELLPKNLRTREPLGGKVGYDKEGTLLGNWFKVGRDPNQREEYWTQNLSIVYDHIDENQIRISFGDFNGYPKAYGVKGNTPDPKDVTRNSGIVKYELSAFDYYDLSDNKWDTIHFAPNLKAKNEDYVVGVVLLELQSDGKLKVEIFPGKSVDQVSGFTSKALIYER